MFPQAMTTIFATMGRPASYVAPGGQAVACRAIRVGGGQPQRFGPVILYTERVAFEVLRSALPAPIVGGTLTVDGTGFTIDDCHPAERDSAGLKWALEVSFGVAVTLRQILGTGATQSPPTISGALILATSAAAGAVTLALKAGYAVGKLLPGDQMLLAGQALTVTGPAQAAANQFSAVPVNPAVAADVAAGAAAVPTFVRDKTVRASIGGYGARELQGGVIAGDLRLMVPQAALDAAGTNEAPKAGDSVLLPGGRLLKVKNASPTYQGSAVAFWELQCGA